MKLTTKQFDVYLCWCVLAPYFERAKCIKIPSDSFMKYRVKGFISLDSRMGDAHSLHLRFVFIHFIYLNVVTFENLVREIVFMLFLDRFGIRVHRMMKVNEVHVVFEAIVKYIVDNVSEYDRRYIMSVLASVIVC